MWPRREIYSDCTALDQLVDEAMRLYGTRTERETVDLALRRLVGASLVTDEALALEGSGWDGDLEGMRADRPRVRVTVLVDASAWVEARGGRAPGLGGRRTARSRGLTVRSTVDCLVAAVALRTASPVLAHDRDFGALRRCPTWHCSNRDVRAVGSGC